MEDIREAETLRQAAEVARDFYLEAPTYENLKGLVIADRDYVKLETKGASPDEIEPLYHRVVDALVVETDPLKLKVLRLRAGNWYDVLRMKFPEYVRAKNLSRDREFGIKREEDEEKTERGFE